MRVAYISLSARGGTALYSAGLASGVSALHDVLLVAPDHMDRSPLGRNVRLCGVNTGRTHAQVALNTLNPANFLLIRQAVRAFEPDTVHFTLSHPWNPPVCAMLSRYPCVFTVHDPVPHEGARWVRVTRLTHSMMYHMARKIIFLSEFSRSQAPLHLQQGGRTTVIPHPVLDYYQRLVTQSCGDSRSVLLFGRLEKYKGIELFVEAAARCGGNFPDVKFILAGGGSIPRELAAHPGMKHVNLINRFLGDAELANLIAQATVVVLPYLSSTQSGALAAAYAFAKPVIVTNVGGLAENVRNGESGIVVPPRNVAALADAIHSVLADCALQQRLASGAASVAKNEMSWERVVEEHLQLYSEVAA